MEKMYTFGTNTRQQNTEQSMRRIKIGKES